MKIGMIGGSGLYRMAPGQEPGEAIPVETPHGVVELHHMQIGGRDTYFLNRHGKGHSTPPHLINYRANILALKAAGVARVIATSAVGTMNPAIKPGDFVVLDTFLDFTKGRASSFSVGGDVFHVDMREAFCPELRESLVQGATFNVQRSEEGKSGGETGFRVHERGVYVAAEGPRFETPAEIRAFRLLGGDVVGMTAVPECVLAREAGMCYANLAVATNWAAGITSHPLTPDEVNAMMAQRGETLRTILDQAIAAIPERRGCGCEGARAKGRVKA